jgi:hypothetical protein
MRCSKLFAVLSLAICCTLAHSQRSRNVSGSAPPAGAAKMPLAIARAHFERGFQSMYRGGFRAGGMLSSFEDNGALSNLRITPNGFSMDWTFVCCNGGKKPYVRNYSFEFQSLPYQVARAGNGTPKTYYKVDLPRVNTYDGAFVWTEEKSANEFVDALNRLIYHAKGLDRAQYTEDFRAFQEKVKSWKASGQKAIPTPEWEKRRLLAEDAIKEKDFPSALAHFEAALESNPFWPDGWFNAALIYGELKDYDAAIDRMKRYLELEPDARDVTKVRDQITIWEAKASQ